MGDDDEFGVEAGGWCCFTNSLLIIYLRMWLNERPLLTTFVSRKIPDGIQLDTMQAEAKKRSASDRDSKKSDGKTQKKSPSESIADAFISFVKIRKSEYSAFCRALVITTLCSQSFGIESPLKKEREIKLALTINHRLWLYFILTILRNRISQLNRSYTFEVNSVFPFFG